MTKAASGSQENDNPFSRIIEKEVQFIKSWGKGKRIHVKLPIRVTPEFTALMSHFLGDGTLGVTNSDASYCQKNETARGNFLKKINTVFGSFEVNQKSYKEFHVLVPKPIADIMRSYYKVPRIGTLEKRLPPKIKLEPRENRLAALTAFLVDEGSIGDSIEIGLANQKLLEDIRQLTLELGYACSPIQQHPGHKSKNSQYRFRISLTSARQLFKDITNLSKQHPTCDLANKQEKLEFIVQRQCRIQRKSATGETKKEIKKLYVQGTKKIAQIRVHLNLSGSTISEHLRDMKKQGII